MRGLSRAVALRCRWPFTLDMAAFEEMTGLMRGWSAGTIVDVARNTAPESVTWISAAAAQAVPAVAVTTGAWFCWVPGVEGAAGAALGVATGASIVVELSDVVELPDVAELSDVSWIADPRPPPPPPEPHPASRQHNM